MKKKLLCKLAATIYAGYKSSGSAHRDMDDCLNIAENLIKEVDKRHPVDEVFDKDVEKALEGSSEKTVEVKFDFRCDECGEILVKKGSTVTIPESGQRFWCSKYHDNYLMPVDNKKNVVFSESPSEKTGMKYWDALSIARKTTGAIRRLSSPKTGSNTVFFMDGGIVHSYLLFNDEGADDWEVVEYAVNLEYVFSEGPKSMNIQEAVRHSIENKCYMTRVEFDDPEDAFIANPEKDAFLVDRQSKIQRMPMMHHLAIDDILADDWVPID